MLVHKHKRRGPSVAGAENETLTVNQSAKGTNDSLRSYKGLYSHGDNQMQSRIR